MRIQGYAYGAHGLPHGMSNNPNDCIFPNVSLETEFENEMKNIPYGAIAFYTLADKLACGLQQLMARARKFSLDKIGRGDIMSGNRETAIETGIAHVSDVNDESARKILNS